MKSQSGGLDTFALAILNNKEEREVRLNLRLGQNYNQYLES